MTHSYIKKTYIARIDGLANSFTSLFPPNLYHMMIYLEKFTMHKMIT